MDNTNSLPFDYVVTATLGAAVGAAVVAGVYPDFPSAQARMTGLKAHSYRPDAAGDASGNVHVAYWDNTAAGRYAYQDVNLMTWADYIDAGTARIDGIDVGVEDRLVLLDEAPQALVRRLERAPQLVHSAPTRATARGSVSATGVSTTLRSPPSAVLPSIVMWFES